MSFERIYRRNKRAGEEISLLKYSTKQTTSESEPTLDELGFPVIDDLGFAERELVSQQTINGIIQRSETMNYTEGGSDSEPSFIGYFFPDFELQTKDVDDYRIEYKRPYETLIMKISEYNPNLYLKGKRHHIRLSLILEKRNTNKKED